MDTLAERFESHRPHLRAVAYRMLGSTAEAEDAVQEAWVRTSRADTSHIENLGGWLTTVVARVCLDVLRSRKSRREDPLPASDRVDDGKRPDNELTLADSIGVAMLVVLEMLAPAERIAFVLHDMFDLPFDEIAPIVSKSPEAARQLASRARRRVHGASISAADRERQRIVVDAFLAASRDGNFEALIAVLDPEVVVRADPAAIAMAASGRAGAPTLAPEMHGAQAVANSFHGRARAARPALVDGLAGAAWVVGGAAKSVFAFTVDNGKITAIDIIMDADHLAALDINLDSRNPS
jgi:RNA polymerase sigma-70 factor (ECF subfamily)